MRLPCFEYLEPGTPKDALSMLSQQRENARIIAGGTDLLPKMKKGILTPKILMNLKAIPGFSYIEDGDIVKIGALTSLRQLEESPLIKNKFSFLAEAAHSVGAVQLRNMGTIGGNICQDTRCWYYSSAYLFGQEVWERCFKRGGKLCHLVKKGKRCYAVYSADLTPVLMALGAKVKLQSLNKDRVIPLNEFFTGAGDRVNVLEPDEMVTEIQVPSPRSSSFGVYLKYRERGAIDFAITGVAVLLAGGSTGGITDAKIVLTSVGSRPAEAIAAEEMLKGRDINERVLDEAANAAAQEIHPVSHHGYSAWYQREIVRVVVKRACTKVWDLIQGRG
jgi:4-hydroxybenzoyl-CoA reductase beta subunit